MLTEKKKCDTNRIEGYMPGVYTRITGKEGEIRRKFRYSSFYGAGARLFGPPVICSIHTESVDRCFGFLCLFYRLAATVARMIGVKTHRDGSPKTRGTSAESKEMCGAQRRRRTNTTVARG